jgi:hypothetical protein
MLRTLTQAILSPRFQRAVAETPADLRADLYRLFTVTSPLPDNFDGVVSPSQFSFSVGAFPTIATINASHSTLTFKLLMSVASSGGRYRFLRAVFSAPAAF